MELPMFSCFLTLRSCVHKLLSLLMSYLQLHAQYFTFAKQLRSRVVKMLITEQKVNECPSFSVRKRVQRDYVLRTTLRFLPNGGLSVGTHI